MPLTLWPYDPRKCDWIVRVTLIALALDFLLTGRNSSSSGRKSIFWEFGDQLRSESGGDGEKVGQWHRVNLIRIKHTYPLKGCLFRLDFSDILMLGF